MEYPNRKHIRLKDYDYSRKGAYFVTICTEKRMQLFQNVGAAPCGRPQQAYRLAQRWLEKKKEKYPTVSLNQYVIMPNHIHLILFFSEEQMAGGPMWPPTTGLSFSSEVAGENTREISHNFIG